MDIGKKQQAIIYVEAKRLFFYPNADGAMVTLDFPPDILSDLEVLNTQKFLDLVTTFFESQKIPPSEILFVFASAITFEKDFDETEKKENIQEFLDYVPFDDILSKSFPFNKKIRVVAINGQLYSLLKEASFKINCTAAGVVSYSSLIPIIPTLSEKVDIQLILTRFDNAKQMSLMPASQEAVTTTKEPQATGQNKRVFLLLGVFGILLLVLLVMVIATLSVPVTPQQPITPQTLPTISPAGRIFPASPSAAVKSNPTPTLPAGIQSTTITR